MLTFEWDDAKGEANLRVHGVGFDMATTAFSDPFAIEWLDDREDYGEDRFVMIGMAIGRSLLYVAHTERQGRIRIISARKATRQEQEEYVHRNT